MARGAVVLVGLTALLLGTASASVAAPDAYSAAEIRGWVVDAETKQPLEGVHVVAQWLLETGMFFHSRRVTPLHIMETVTDAKGEYYFPAWGPKPRPTFASLDTSADPRITFFRPGYRSIDLHNDHDADTRVRTSRWHGQTISLQRFRESVTEWALQLSLVQIRLGWGAFTETTPRRVNDNWKHLPHIILTIAHERRTLPTEARYVVADLDAWGVSEEQLRTLIDQRGSRK